MGIKAKPIKPGRFNAAAFNDALTEMANNVKDNLLRDYRRTSETWDGEKPEYSSEVDTSLARILIAVIVGGSEKAQNKWGWLDKGTSVRRAVMSRDWKSKTKVWRLTAGPGSGRVVFISKKIALPGIEARGWTDMILETWRPKFQEMVFKATEVGWQKCGHAI